MEERVGEREEKERYLEVSRAVGGNNTEKRKKKVEKKGLMERSWWNQCGGM